MFNSISQNYDLTNTVMTFGLDALWRKYLLQWARLSPGQWVLDVGTGTGKLLRGAEGYGAGAIGLDMSERMLFIAKGKNPNSLLVLGDALMLPFKEHTFERVISAFLLRNASDLATCLAEQFRVLKAKGLFLALETAPIPKDSLLYSAIYIYLRWVVPLLGFMITRNMAAFRYLIESTASFKTPLEMEAILKKTGFINVRHRRFAFGTTVVYYGEKP